MPATVSPPEIQRSVCLWLKTQAETVDAGVLVPALLFTEGDFVDGAGNKGSYSRADLNKIVRSTSKYYHAGGEIPIFESNHDFDGGYQNGNKIGRLAVDEGLTVEQITEDNLPDPRFTDLIGRFGIFGHGLITRTDAVERYQQMLIKPLSIAFDPSGKFTEGHKWSIFEVSAVPWGAVRGAMFFGKYPTIAGPTPPTKMALTLEGAMAEYETHYGDPMDEESGQLLMVFNSVLQAIRHTTEEELLGRDRNELMRQAVADLSAKLTEMLGVQRAAPPPVVASKFTQGEPPMAEDITPATPEETTTPPKAEAVDMSGLMARIEALEAKNTELESAVTQQANRAEEAEQVAQRLSFERQVSDKVTRLRNWAQKLVRLGKLTPAAYAEWFPETEEHSDAIARFSRPAGDEAEAGEAQLAEIEAALKYTDKHVAPVKFGSAIGGQPIGDNPYRDAELNDDDKAQIDQVVKAAKARRYY